MGHVPATRRATRATGRRIEEHASPAARASERHRRAACRSAPRSPARRSRAARARPRRGPCSGACPARVCQTSACTMRSTLSSARVARSEREPRDEEREDPLPGRQVADPGERLRRQPADPGVAGERAGILARRRWPRGRRPRRAGTRTGIMKRNTRNATAPASTPPPAATSRSNAPNSGVEDLRVADGSPRAARGCARSGRRPSPAPPRSRSIRDCVIASSSASGSAGRWQRSVIGRVTASIRPSATACSSAAWSATVWSAYAVGERRRWPGRTGRRRPGTRRWRRRRPIARAPGPTSRRTAWRSARARPA